MHDLVQDELKHVLEQWRAGNGVQSIALGHSTREIEVDGMRVHEHHVFRQKLTHQFVFALIESQLENAPSIDFELFDVVADDKAKEFKLTAEELAAGKSLAWVALRRGWTQALAGFPNTHTITVKQVSQG